MGQQEKLVQHYQRRQVKLRAQISAVKAGKFGIGGKKTGTGIPATIRRIERQISDLEKAIVKCREKNLGPESSES
jgi:hypothetical protein